VSNYQDFDVKDRVKQATDIVDLIGGMIPLTQKGRDYVGLCPWHDDTRPSFTVNPVRPALNSAPTKPLLSKVVPTTNPRC